MHLFSEKRLFGALFCLVRVVGTAEKRDASVCEGPDRPFPEQFAHRFGQPFGRAGQFGGEPVRVGRGPGEARQEFFAQGAFGAGRIACRSGVSGSGSGSGLPGGGFRGRLRARQMSQTPHGAGFSSPKYRSSTALRHSCSLAA